MLYVCYIRFPRAWIVQGDKSVGVSVPLQGKCRDHVDRLGLDILVIVAATALLLVKSSEVGVFLTLDEKVDLYFEQSFSLPVVMVTYLVDKFLKWTKTQRVSTINIVRDG